ncbi:MAG: hypothetical protein FJ278_20605 [Planctomycetes bacterium]|nr:hypothetical protein [Planctomycetota bacterium]
MKWKTTQFAESQLDGDKKIRFHLKNADLYSYLPDQNPGKLTVTYVPAENGGLLPSDEKIPESLRFAMRGKPSGYRVVSERGWVYADLHSVAAEKTSACFTKDADWTDDVDWCVEAWYRVADMGTEPNYGLATFVSPSSARNAAIFLSDKAVGIISSRDHTHQVLKSVDMNTTDGFHWYRLVHSGGEKGTISLSVDGKEAICLAYTDLFHRGVPTPGIMFGPNAGHMEGRLHVAKFGYRVGSTDPLFGPVKQP